MKRIFLLLSMALFLGSGLSSCTDEAEEITPEYQAPQQKAVETEGTTTKEKPIRGNN